ncbi:uncharacterized protein BJ171DRAFT_611451 [Polychytrium aggregatum]|uniref:uncharacterized protein n=1 Tax=Polychytrium aggregatum TaxID=110093 RepID=UPI0022FE17E6|nr:uncharacterized protein BJ171DRAFT_611451 [Polychytrium aggregatum]KAI9206426.1 hypothetical protein BJ171DRAFT_611451 [Polychytrium aggregatum]
MGVQPESPLRPQDKLPPLLARLLNQPNPQQKPHPSGQPQHLPQLQSHQQQHRADNLLADHSRALPKPKDPPFNPAGPAQQIHEATVKPCSIPSIKSLDKPPNKRWSPHLFDGPANFPLRERAGDIIKDHSRILKPLTSTLTHRRNYDHLSESAATYFEQRQLPAITVEVISAIRQRSERKSIFGHYSTKSMGPIRQDIVATQKCTLESTKSTTLNSDLLTPLSVSRADVPAPRSILTPAELMMTNFDTGSVILHNPKRARARWKSAIRIIITFIRIRSVFAPLGHYEAHGIPARKTQMSLLGTLRAFQTPADKALTERVQQTLISPCYMRDPQKLKSLERLLINRMPAFASYNSEQRTRFIEVMGYEMHPMGSVIIKQDHIGSAFYFLLSGQCEVWKYGLDDRRVHMRMLNAGCTFGELACDDRSSRLRTATIQCTMDSEFLRVYKDDYIRITLGHDTEEELQVRVDVLSSIPLFQLNDPDQYILKSLAQKSQKKTYDHGQTVLIEDEPNGNIFVVVSGRVRISKRVKFLVKMVHGKRVMKRYPLDQASGEVPEPGQVVEETLIIRELDAGAIFPEFIFPGKVHETPMINGVDPVEVERTITKQDLYGVTPAYTTVTAMTQLELVSINKLEFCRVVNPQMMAQIITETTGCYLSYAELQETWLQMVEWKRFKTEMMREKIEELDRKKTDWESTLDSWRAESQPARCRM